VLFQDALASRLDIMGLSQQRLDEFLKAHPAQISPGGSRMHAGQGYYGCHKKLWGPVPASGQGIACLALATGVLGPASTATCMLSTEAWQWQQCAAEQVGLQQTMSLLLHTSMSALADSKHHTAGWVTAGVAGRPAHSGCHSLHL
jgi:hypothetical protein